MTERTSPIDAYFQQLTREDHDRLESRMEQYRDQLEAQGYEVALAEGEQGFFGGVLVIDDAQGRYGFLEENGAVSWLSGDMGGLGALGSAVVQNPSEHLQQGIDEMDGVDVE